MVKSRKTGIEVRVGLEKLWQVMSKPKDLAAISAKLVPEQIIDMQVVEGDGGVGTILLYVPSSISGLSDASYKEKIAELDATRHEIGFEYVEGGFLNRGFSYFKIGAQLCAKGEHRTEVNLKISYESDNDEETTQQLIQKAESAAFNLLRNLEKYLSNGLATSSD
ncbi:phytohormone-binding protein CSBP-like [Prosopis cineraria]|uniref:phytohormone-binding protein CSBP-like n=1 Tax=Prosopis cineraria TaxID=364024 RepID=UPI00240F4E4C|nr:phytohormone-binding protein CSBP-like [Prosopis cineraria]